MATLRHIAFMLTIVLYFALNYYVFWRMNKWLATGLGWKYHLIGVVITFASLFLIVWHGNPFRFIHHLAGYWFGLMFLALVTVAVVDLVSRIFSFKPEYSAVIAISLTAILFIISIVNIAIGRKIVHVELSSPKISTPVRIALIADTHISGYHDGSLLSDIVDEINAQQPDVLLISGDFADGETQYEAVAPIDNLKAPAFLALGNHDVWHNEDGRLEDVLGKTKLEILDNRSVIINDLQIVGATYQDGRKVLDDALADIVIDESLYSILVYHVPNEIDVAKSKGFDLMLCGHTHGGQIFPFTIAVRIAYTYFKGLYEHEGMKIYVSQGTSTWGPRMRLGTRNEITIINVNPAI